MIFRRERLALKSGESIMVDGCAVRLSVNARAKCVRLRLDVSTGQMVAVAPSVRRLPDAVAFARARSAWIAARLDEAPVRLRLTAGQTVWIGGEPHRLERAAMRVRPRLVAPIAEEPGRLIAAGEGDAFARAAQRALRAEALARLTACTLRHCRTLGVPVPMVGLQDARSRWGSCRQAHAGADARIRYSWRLIMAPSAVLDYVAAHECAHLAEANHGPRFWALVVRLYGDPAPARAWLKTHGATLHAVG